MYGRTFETGFIRSTLSKSRPKNGRISNFEGLVTLTLTLDQVIILHTVVHHSSTSTNVPNFIQINNDKHTVKSLIRLTM